MVAICFCWISGFAQDKLIFIVGNNVCTPVTVKCAGPYS